jgi:PAS domain-containing protein
MHAPSETDTDQKRRSLAHRSRSLEPAVIQAPPDVAFKGILDHMLEGCQIIGFDWRYRYVNEAVVRHARKSADELLGRTMMEVFPGIERTAMFATLAGCMANRTPAKLLNEFQYPDGTIGWFDLSFQPIEQGVFIMSLDVTGHRQNERRIQQQVDHLRALREIDLAILRTPDWRFALRTVVDQVRTQLRVDAVAIATLNPNAFSLELAASDGLDRQPAEPLALLAGDGICARAVRERRTIAVTDPHHLSPAVTQLASLVDGIESAWATPLVAKGVLLGVLAVACRSIRAVDADWVAFFETLAGQAAMAIDSGRSFEALQASHLELGLAYETTIEGWSRALELRDRETQGHSQRVTTVTVALARLAGVSDASLAHVRRGALLHDIGKMGIPDSILLKAGDLTAEELHIMRDTRESGTNSSGPSHIFAPRSTSHTAITRSGTAAAIREGCPAIRSLSPHDCLRLPTSGMQCDPTGHIALRGPTSRRFSTFGSAPGPTSILMRWSCSCAFARSPDRLADEIA